MTPCAWPRLVDHYGQEAKMGIRLVTTSILSNYFAEAVNVTINWYHQ